MADMGRVLGMNRSGGGEMQMQTASAEAKYRPFTITEQLEQRKARLEDELERVNAALAVLAANPGVQDVLEVLSKAM